MLGLLLWTVLALPCGLCWFAQRETASPALLAYGKDQLAKLDREAGNEGFFDMVFGTNCYSRAVQGLRSGCNGMDADASLGLAFDLTNCLFAKTGRRTYRCARKPATGACVGDMESDDYLVFTQFLQNIHSMCLFVESTDFHRRSEIMLSTLFTAGASAAVKVDELNQKLDSQSSVLRDIDTEVGGIQERQQLLQEGLARSSEGLAHLQHAATQLEASMHSATQAQEALLAAETATAQKIATLQEEHEVHARSAAAAWKEVEARADELRSWQVEQQGVQRDLLASAEAIVAASAGVHATLNVIETTQQRSHRLLYTLLGKSYTWTDIWFYGTGMALTWVLGWSQHTQGARLPLLLTLALTLLTERGIGHAVNMWQMVDATGDVVLRLPMAVRWLLGTPTAEDLKLYMRCVAAAAVVLTLIWSMLRSESHSSFPAQVTEQLYTFEQRQIDAWLDFELRMIDYVRSMAQGGKATGTKIPDEEEHGDDNESDDKTQRHSPAPGKEGLLDPTVAWQQRAHAAHQERSRACSDVARSPPLWNCSPYRTPSPLVRHSMHTPPALVPRGTAGPSSARTNTLDMSATLARPTARRRLFPCHTPGHDENEPSPLTGVPVSMFAGTPAAAHRSARLPDPPGLRSHTGARAQPVVSPQIGPHDIVPPASTSHVPQSIAGDSLRGGSPGISVSRGPVREEAATGSNAAAREKRPADRRPDGPLQSSAKRSRT